MLQRLISSAAAVAFVAIVSTSCSGGGGGTDGGAPDPQLTCDAAPPATSFATVYNDIFTPSCIGSCHIAGATDGSDSYGLYATEAAAFGQVGKVSLFAGTEKTLKVVDPSNLGNSTMYLKVLGYAKSPAGKVLSGQMPLNAQQLTAGQKKLLKDWICSGAKP